MKRFLKTKPGAISAVAFVAVMAIVLFRIAGRRRSRARALLAPVPVAAAPLRSTPPVKRPASPPPAPATGRPLPPGMANDLAQNAAYLDQYYAFNRRVRTGRDRQGNPVTRRRNAATPSAAGHVTVDPGDVAATMPPARTSLRLVGHPPIGAAPQPSSAPKPAALRAGLPAERPAPPSGNDPSEAARATPGIPPEPGARPRRFNPYGSLIKCELVFTIDSTNEQTPLIGLVVEPVYNNGELVIPAGAELHGVARPDRLRDRIFSGQDWVLIFPREPGRPNGRQLHIRGVALDRVEPDGNGMTWGITDGSYGLQGQVVRTLKQEEIKRFAASFLAAATETLETRDALRGRRETVRTTPQNAVLQGLSANLARIADEVSAEIERNGVFIRVPGGHQFYFYPTQIIDPDAAAI